LPNFGPLSLPHSINLTSLKDFWARANFSKALFNSTFISVWVAILAASLSLLNAFALGIGKVKGRAWLLVFFLMANFLPQESLAYPCTILPNSCIFTIPPTQLFWH